MKLDILIPKSKREEITEFIRCRPALQVLDFVRTPLDYHTWLVPVRQLQDNCLQCQVYFVKWDCFDTLCNERYKLSINNKKLYLVIQVDHFMADIKQKNKKDGRRSHSINLKCTGQLIRKLLQCFEITLISEYPQSVISDVIKQLGLERDMFLDQFHRRIFGGVPRSYDGFYSFAQYFEFYHYTRRRNTVLGIGQPNDFTASDRPFIFHPIEDNTSEIVEQLVEIQKLFFSLVPGDDVKSTSSVDLNEVVNAVKKKHGLDFF